MKQKPARKNFHKERIFSLEQNKTDFDYVQQIQKKAYEIYAQKGYPHGEDQEHWYEAERSFANGQL